MDLRKANACDAADGVPEIRRGWRDQAKQERDPKVLIGFARAAPAEVHSSRGKYDADEELAQAWKKLVRWLGQLDGGEVVQRDCEHCGHRRVVVAAVIASSVALVVSVRGRIAPAVRVPLAPIILSLRDAGGNAVTAQVTRRIRARLTRGPGDLVQALDTTNDADEALWFSGISTLTFSGLALIEPTITTTLGDSGNIPGGEHPYFNITFETDGLESTFVLFTMVVGEAYKLSIPSSVGPLYSPYTDTNERSWVVVESYESLAVTSMSSIPVVLLDGGNNKLGELDVNIDGESRTDRSVNIRVFRANGAPFGGFQPPLLQRIVEGECRFATGDVFLVRPPRGTYRIEVYSEGLVSGFLTITVTRGPAYQLEVEGYDEARTYAPFNPSGNANILL